MSAPVLVLGRAGQVARALVAMGEAMRIPVTAAGRETFDLRTPGDLAGLIRSTGASGVVNASGYTAVDAAETDVGAAERLNAQAPAEIARACGAVGVPLVHLSTDYVFDGAGGAPYTEEAPTNPLNVYGRTKLEGERMVLTSDVRAAVVRTSWVYDAEGQNFVRTMLRLSDTMDEIAVVHDQRGRPTFATDIAAGALLVLDRLLQGAPSPGLLHLAGGGDASWAEFAEEILRQTGRRTRVKRIATADRPSPARRPADSRLAIDKAAALYGMRPIPWTERLGDCLREMEAVSA